VLTRAAHEAAGLAARAQLPVESIAAWSPPADRQDPVALILGQATTRVPELVPIRHARMAVSPFTFYRGAALPMAADLSTRPNTGIVVQLCGDAHLLNFGLFASPERDLVFDINDFDETLHGPFEWDVLRLATSLVVAGRSRGFAEHESRHAVHRLGRTYVDRMAGYAGLAPIDVYYTRVDAATVLGAAEKRARPFLEETLHAARHRDSAHEVPKLTTVDAEGRRRIGDHPPLIVHEPEATPERIASLRAAYRDSLAEDRRLLLDRYEVVDVARKVVGVGSVGLEALVGLMEGGDGDPLFLQVKQAEASVLERFLAPSPMPGHGARVVAGQRRLQATSDVLLGYAVGDLGRHWYVRQLQDQKGGAVVEAMTAEDLASWGELCGWALARGHARTGEPAMIAGYLGTGRTFEHALGEFAAAYADQTDRDHTAFVEAIRAGRVTAAES